MGLEPGDQRCHICYHVTVIADLINDRKPYDIISFDFQRAFDKVPHNLLLKALQHLQLHSTSLQWIASFLTDRTQRVVLVDCVSTVSSGAVQGSVLGPTFFTVFIDPLLCRLNERIPGMSFAFADDVKFVSETGKASSVKTQVAIDIVKEWSDEQEMPLSVEKG